MCCPGLSVCAVELERCDAIPGPVVAPAELTIGVNRQARFTATGENVTWEVEDGLIGGSIDADGMYYAPPSPGVFHVVARSSFGARRVAITVRELRLSLLAGDYGGPSMFPIDGVGADARVAIPSGGVLVAGSYFFLDSGLVSDRVVRRLELSTRRVTTVFRSSDGPRIDGPPGIATFASIRSLGTSTGNHFVISEFECLREVDAVTLLVSTVSCFDSNAQPDLFFADERHADDAFVYALNPRSRVIARAPRGDSQTQTIIAGTRDMAGNSDSLLDGPSTFAVHAGEVFIIDQHGAALRKTTTAGGPLTTLTQSLSASFWALSPFSETPGLRSPLVLDSEGFIGPLGSRAGLRPVVGARSFAVENEREVVVTTADGIVRHQVGRDLSETLIGRSGGAPGLDDGLGSSARFALSYATFAVAGDTVWIAEEITGKVRSVSRDGRVSTRFTGVDARTLAIDATHLYLTTRDGDVRRRPLDGSGTWETLAFDFTTPVLHGVLDDGRIVVTDSGTVFFIAPATFEVLPERHERLGVFQGFFDGATAALDPKGGLFFTGMSTQRYDFATRTVQDLGARLDFTIPAGGLSYAHGHLYQVGVNSTSFGECRVFEFDFTLGQWRTLVGQRNTGGVVLGPLPSALLHEPVWIAGLSNGDVVIADRAEHALVVIE